LINSIVFGIFAVIAYIAATSLIIKSAIVSPSKVERNHSKTPPYLLLAWIAAVAHGLCLADRMWSNAGINFSLPETAALIILIIVVILLTTAFSKPVDNLGILIFPLAALVLTMNLIIPQKAQHLNDASPGMQLHILSSILAFSLLNIAAVQAILLAVQDHQLHHHKSNRFIRSLPPLQTMESLLFQMIGAGVILLTLSLGSGLLFVEDLLEQHLAHKTVLSVFAWIVFSVLLWGRARHGWRGQTAIRWTLGGFASLMLAYFGSRMVLEIILQRV